MGRKPKADLTEAEWSAIQGLGNRAGFRTGGEGLSGNPLNGKVCEGSGKAPVGIEGGCDRHDRYTCRASNCGGYRPASDPSAVEGMDAWPTETCGRCNAEVGCDRHDPKPSATKVKEEPKCWSCGTTKMEQVAPGARNFVHLPGCKR